nr:tRNA-dihydrouridine synthase family protein [uncultured Merdimonas sp.]
MKYYLAPLEGITTDVYRRAYHACFHPMDKYFTPFLVPHTKRGFNAREEREILPENNPGMYLVPQIMSNDADSFLRTEEKLRVYGYEEVNLNLGCPSKTVVSKNRGSGFLSVPDELDRFLDKIFSGTKGRISIKTRIGKNSPEEFEEILRIYNQYPVEELIIHPRVQKDFYKNHPNMEVFAWAFRESKIPVCYNGDIFASEDEKKIQERFPDLSCIMLGRGIIRNPGLVSEIRGGAPASRDRLRRFHDQIFQDYQKISMGEKNVLFKMKELWSYMGAMFPGQEKALKKIKKAEKSDRYLAAVEEILG